VLLGVLDVRTLIVGSGVVAVGALLAVCRPLLAGRDLPPAPADPAADDRVLTAAAEGDDAS
jgi:hypothetical protein